MSENKLDYDVHVTHTGDEIRNSIEKMSKDITYYEAKIRKIWEENALKKQPPLTLYPVLLDRYAMSFIQRGDTVQDAFRNAALAMEERKKYL